jgi:uncharacterized membrane protein YbhN (UPF0104 family)
MGVVLLVTAAVLAGLVGWAGAEGVLGLLRGAGYGHLLAATLLTLLLPTIHAWRFRAVLVATGYPVSKRRAFDLTMATWPISAITPSKSGDLLKAYYLRQEVPAAVTLGGVLAERVIDVAAWGGLALIGAISFGQLGVLAFSAVILGSVLAFFVLAPWAKRLPLKRSWLDRVDLLLASTAALSRSPRALALMVGLTLVNCLLTILVTAILFDAVGARVPLLFTLAGLPPAMFAGLVPFTIAGMGTRDSVLIMLFADYASTAQSLSVGILYAFFFRWLLSLLGLPFLQRLTSRA